MPFRLECRTGALAGRDIIIAPDRPRVFRIQTASGGRGEVSLAVVSGFLQVTNQAAAACTVNGRVVSAAQLGEADVLMIGREAFLVRADLDADATQAMASPPAAIVAPAVSHHQGPGTCSVCDGPAAVGSWRDDAGRCICRGCLAKGVKPDHLPRSTGPAPPPRPADIDVMEPPLDRDAPLASARPAGERDATDGDGDGRRASRRISASRLASVPGDGDAGLLKRMSSMFTGRADRQKLDDLERERTALLIEVGRMSLSGGGFGLPGALVAKLLKGRAVTIDPRDLPPALIDRWRAQRSRLGQLDVEIAALRRALGLGRDPGPVLALAPLLRGDIKASQERSFATMDSVLTEDLTQQAEHLDTTDPTAPSPSPSGRRAASRRRR